MTGEPPVPGVIKFKIVQVSATTFTAFFNLDGSDSYTQIGGTFTGQNALNVGSPSVIALMATDGASCNFDDFSITNVAQ